MLLVQKSSFKWAATESLECDFLKDDMHVHI